MRRGYRLALLTLALLGAVVGLFTGLQATRGIDVGPVRVSVGAVAALVLTAGLGSLAAWLLRSRDAAFAPGVGWFVAVLTLLFAPHPGGDIVLPGDGVDAIAFLLLGIGGTIIAGAIATRLLPARPATRAESASGRSASSRSASSRSASNESAGDKSAGPPSPQPRHRR